MTVSDTEPCPIEAADPVEGVTDDEGVEPEAAPEFVGEDVPLLLLPLAEPLLPEDELLLEVELELCRNLLVKIPSCRCICAYLSVIGVA
jgi:hypothetical protein